MPTGYTADIQNGITFEKFVMTCARAFGACVSLRDKPLSSEIPEKFEPSSYHTEQLEIEKANLKKLSKMSYEELEIASTNEYRETIDRYTKFYNEANERKRKYENMLEQVYKWNPPTKNHIGLKSFMVDQIKISIQYDCDSDYYKRLLKRVDRLLPEEWKEKEFVQINKSILHHEEELAKEIKTAEESTKWVADLRKSLEKSRGNE